MPRKIGLNALDPSLTQSVTSNVLSNRTHGRKGAVGVKNCLSTDSVALTVPAHAYRRHQLARVSSASSVRDVSLVAYGASDSVVYKLRELRDPQSTAGD